jgi:3',5'-cyclic AMP phosphodiesterase CpdA
MKIAHIADLHICSTHKRTNIKSATAIINAVIKEGADHLVITGDIADNASEKDFQIMRRILKNAGMLDSRKTSIIIGNHDIFGSVQTAEDILSFPMKCRNTDYQAKVAAFYNTFTELFEGVIKPASNEIFPYVKIIGDTALFGINTIDVYSKLKNPFASNGKVPRGQFNDLIELFERDEVKDKRKLVLTHHQFSKYLWEAPKPGQSLWQKIERQTMKLRGKKKLLSLFIRNNVEVVFHGHVHDSREYWRSGIRFSNAGGTMNGSSFGEFKINFIEINESSTDFEVRTFAPIPARQYESDAQILPFVPRAAAI